MKRSGGIPASTRNALRVLRDAGIMERYSADDKVVLDCHHCVVIDAPVRRAGKYSSYCPECETWCVIVRRANSRDSLGGKTESIELW